MIVPQAPPAETSHRLDVEKLDTLRHRIIQRAGRLTRPQGQLTLTMSANEALRKDLIHFLDVLQKAA
jgi:hypothetical protein